MTDAANGIVIADAIRIVQVEAPTPSVYIMERTYSPWTGALTGWQTIVTATLPSMAAGYYKVELDAHSWQTNSRLGIGIGVDSASADATTTRYYDSNVGGDTEVLTGVHTQEVFYLPAGSHTFYFRAGNVAGAGEVQLQNSHITVTFFPTGSIG